MVDVTAKIGQSVVEKVITEAQKNTASVSSGVGGESDFAKVLSNKLETQTEMTKQIMNSFGMGSDAGKVKALSAEGLEISPAQVTGTQEIRTNGKALDLLTDVNRGALQMDSLMELTTSGKKFSPGELLAMQAGMHQIALSIDLTGKIVEQVNTGTKQLLNTNFQ